MSKKAKNKNLSKLAAKPAVRKRHDRLIAVIDIGSNSVRMVVYKGLIRLPHILFNERVLCGLGRDVTHQGVMNQEAMALATTTLLRFSELCRDMAVDHIEAFATAAMRDSRNGNAFAKEICQKCGFRVRVLSGEEEARYSALGVLCAEPDADGVVADLGGGSLELVRVKRSKVQERVTLPLGPLRLLGNRQTLRDKDLRHIRATIGEVKWLKKGTGRTLYLVGGAWRALATLHQAQSKFPVPVLQGYAIDAKDAQKFANLVATQSITSLAGISSVQSRRLAILPVAAAILAQLIRRTKPDNVVISVYGTREGVMFNKLGEAVRAKDPLIESAKEIADRTGRFPEHADILMRWTTPLFRNEKKRENRLRRVICLLCDNSWQAHPSYRAERAYREAFYGRFVGLTHRDRALIAYALFICYGGGEASDVALPAVKLMTEGDMAFALTTGRALRLGQRLTGGTARPLEYSTIKIHRGVLVLYLPDNLEQMAGDSVCKRLNALGRAMDLPTDVRFRKEVAK